MRPSTLVALLSVWLAALPAHAETTRDKLLEIVETMANTLASKQALRPIIEKASDAQISAFDRGLYFEEIGDGKAARRYYERAVAALDQNAPGKDAWCVAYKLLRIPDDKADKNHPAVKEMLDLRKALNIPLTAGDLEKTATTARIRELWNALPEAAQAETGPLPNNLSLIERAVALAGRSYNQDDTPFFQPINASARCWLRGPNLKPFYAAAAQLDLPDFQMDLANELAKAKFPGLWQDAVAWYRRVAENAQPPLSVIAATGAARVGERLLSADTPHPPPMSWPEILAAYRAGMAAGHEAAHVLYADALQRGLGGLKADEAEAVRLYKALIDKQGGFYGGLTTLIFMVYAQEQLTELWKAGKLELNAAEQQRYLTLKARPAAQPVVRDESRSPLVQAVLERDQQEALRLIEAGAELDVEASRDAMHQRTPSRFHTENLAESLPLGYPLASVAAALGLPEVLKAIGRRAPELLHRIDADGRTALAYAALGGHAQSTRILLDHGLDPLHPAQRYPIFNTPLSLATHRDETGIVALLMTAIPREKLGHTAVLEAVWTAASKRNIATLHTLLEAGASPDYIAPQGGTALIEAVKYRKLDFVRLLLKHGATVDDHLYRGFSVLQYAEQNAKHDDPAAREILELIRTAPRKESGWKKSREVEHLERLWRQMERPAETKDGLE